MTPTPHRDRFVEYTDPLPEAMVLVSRGGVVHAANRAFRARVGAASAGLEGRPLSDFVANGQDAIEGLLRAAARSRDLVPGHLSLRAKDGAVLACRAEGALAAAPTADGSSLIMLRLTPRESAVGRFVALNQRIDELARENLRRRQAEDAARREEERLRVTLSSIGDGVIVTDPRGLVRTLNPVAQALTGWTQEDAAGRDLREVFRIVNETTRATVENPALRALADGVVMGLANHTILIAKDGVERPIDDSAAPIGAGDERVGAVLVFRDITARRGAERALRESESRFRELAELLPQIVWAARDDGSVFFSNGRWSESTGAPGPKSPEDWTAVLHPNDATRAIAGYRSCIADERPFQAEVRLADHRSGRYRWHLCRAVPVRGAAGGVTHWFGTFTDIDDTKRFAQRSAMLAAAGAALAEAAEPADAMRAVAQAAVPDFADACVVDLVDDAGTCERVGAIAGDDELARRARESADTTPLIPHGASVPDGSAIVKALGATSCIVIPLTARGRLRGAVAFVSAGSGREFDEGDRDAAFDLAGRASAALENAYLARELREEHRRKDEFLATLAHELRNPLAPIRTGLHLLRVADAATTARLKGIMERQLQHMVRIIDDLLDVSRITRGLLRLDRATRDLRAIVADALETCGTIAVGDDRRLHVHVAQEPMWVDSDGTRLVQAICNIVNNARKFTAPDGSIELSARPDGDHAVVSVRDDGIGIPQAMLENIFDMFVQGERSSDGTQSGLGIGLTITRRIVELHGGTIEAKSEGLGRGSTFIVRLPLTSAPTTPPSGPPPEVAVLARRILVADDNVDAAQTLADLLAGRGHEVRTASDGEQALAMAAEFRPDVAFLDIGMPRLDGHEVCRRLRLEPWGARMVVVALTGWGQASDRAQSIGAGFDHHLVKPVEPWRIDALLDRARVGDHPPR